MISTLSFALAIGSQQLAPVPPPPDRLFVDCHRPVYATEHLICETPELLDQERRLVELWQGLEVQGETVAEREEQQAWFSRRAMCAFHNDHFACVQAANVDRLNILEQMVAPALPRAAPMPATTDATVGTSGFHATAEIRCHGPGLPTAGWCRVGVVRRVDHSADIVVLPGEAAEHILLFDPQGRPVTPRAQAERIGADTTVVSLDDRRYDIPDALLWGG